MFEAVVGGLLQVLQVKAVTFMLLGIGLGFCVGLLPGIGGATTLALLLAFVYTMEPVEALAFLLGMHAVVATTGDITAILFGIPGEATSAATVLDGYAMAKQGEAGRALGAALTSSLVGAVIGAVALALAIPIVRPLVLVFGSPEMFMLGLMGIAFIVSLSGDSPRAILRGFASGALGLLCATVGQDPQAGILRFTFGQLYLWDGLDIVPVLIGLFAIPEVVDLAVRGTAIAEGPREAVLKGGVMEGVRDTFRHWWLTVRCSLIGTFIGVMPGLGGSVAQWLAYGHAVQSAADSADRSRFGKGDVRGVLGPGAANNSKEGGALIPTIAFGIPGSAGMAILLGAFLLLGLVPGPEMLSRHLTLTYSMVWTIVLANIVAVALSLLFLNHLARLTTVRASLLVPLLLTMVFIGSYTANNHVGDLVVMLGFGLVACLMVRAEWPRAPFVLGLVLGGIVENYFYISVARYGASWLLRPIVLVILGLTILAVVWPLVGARRARGAGRA